MTTKTQQYAIQSLAACGFAVMRSTVAYRLRPDLWSSAQECGFDFTSKSIGILDGVKRVGATLDGIGEVVVLTRSLGHLAERIQWVTGHMVLKIEEEQPEAQAQAVAPPLSESQKKAAENLAQLKKVAAQELPAHDCALRKDILAARRELGMVAA